MMLEAMGQEHTWSVKYATGHRPLANTVKAAELARVTVRTIYNWMRLGKVEYVRTPTGGVRIYVDTLLRSDPEDYMPCGKGKKGGKRPKY